MIDIRGYGRRLAAAVDGAVGGVLTGVYVHGSLALGGFRPDRSDVDVLAVIDAPLSPDRQGKVADALLRAAYPCPGTGLECSVITAATAADLGDCRFEVHVATPDTAVIGEGRGGDPDLVLYAEVCRRSGITVTGPPADSVFGAVPYDRLRTAIVDEMAWGLSAWRQASAPFEYAVLNTCRGLLFARDGSLRSKVAGGEWYLAEHPADPVVAAALSRQLGVAVDEPSHDAVADFVERAIRDVGVGGVTVRGGVTFRGADTFRGGDT
jgi:streptomycin 3"-adenylyltransferase